MCLFTENLDFDYGQRQCSEETSSLARGTGNLDRKSLDSTILRLGLAAVIKGKAQDFSSVFNCISGEMRNGICTWKKIGNSYRNWSLCLACNIPTKILQVWYVELRFSRFCLLCRCLSWVLDRFCTQTDAVCGGFAWYKMNSIPGKKNLRTNFPT